MMLLTTVVLRRWAAMVECVNDGCSFDSDDDSEMVVVVANSDVDDDDGG